MLHYCGTNLLKDLNPAPLHLAPPQVFKQDGVHYLQDLGSRTGTWVNKRRLTSFNRVVLQVCVCVGWGGGGGWGGAGSHPMFQFQLSFDW